MEKRRGSPVTRLLGSLSPSSAERDATCLRSRGPSRSAGRDARRSGAAGRRRSVWLVAILVAGMTALAQAPAALATLTVAYDAGSVTVTESAPFRSTTYSATNTLTPPHLATQTAFSGLRLWELGLGYGFPADTAIGPVCKYVFGVPGLGLGNAIECGNAEHPVTSVRWELGEGGGAVMVTDTLVAPLALELGAGNDTVVALAPPTAPVTADGGPGTNDRVSAYWCQTVCPTTGVTLSLSGGAVSGIANLTATNFEGLNGSEGPDRLTGSASPTLEQFGGFGGNDVIDDGGGPDFINGGNGNDTIRARDGAPDEIFCGEGTDTVEADLDGPTPLDSINDECEIVNAPPPPPAAGCGTRQVQVGQVTVEGTLAETGPGSGVFRAGPGDVVYAGGFELRPRVGGELLVDPGAGTLAEAGAGVDVHFGAVPVPLGVAAIPVRHADATLALNRDGTLLKTLFSLPISGQLKAAWADGGRAAALELELEAEKLLGSFGTFQSGAVGGVQAPSLKIQARQVNCTGFDLTGAEVRAAEISFIPTALKVPRRLGLKNVVFKYEDRGGHDFWSGQGELLLPISSSSPELAVGGKVSITDSKLAGVGVSVSGINRRLAHGFFLQSISGELAFEPSFGASFVVDGTFGPQVRGKKLASFGGNFKLFALATDCTGGQDPIALGFTAAIPVVEELGAGSIKYEGLNCLYTTSLAFEQTGKIDATLGQVVNGAVPNPVVAVKANLSGFVGEDRLSLEGGGSVTLPLIGELGGQVLLSTRALAACARIGFFAGGAAHVWGQTTTAAFTGCDLGPWRSPPAAGSGRGARAPRAVLSRSRSASVDLPAGLPFAGLAVEGATGPPRVRVLGPRGERVVSPAGKALVGSRFVIVPVAAERRTFVFVRRPSAGRWRVQALGRVRLRRLRTARGLPAPRVSGVLERDGAAVALRYEVASLRGQEVTFIERTRDGVVKVLGRARGRSGRLRFTPASTGQDARIEASVVQDGFPRATVDVARFRAAAGKAPARPARVRARRAGRGLALSWSRVRTASRYRVDVLRGTRRIARRTTARTRLRLARVPATTLRVQVRAIGSDGFASAARSTVVRRAR